VRVTGVVAMLARMASPHVLFLYRSRQSTGSPVGLGVTALHSVRVLRHNGLRADLAGVWSVDDIHAALSRFPSTTHCVIEAPWVSSDDTAALASRYPSVQFIVRAHSQIGFLQVEAGAIRILRELMHLQDHTLNVSVCANSELLANFLERTYSGECLHLPNLYDASRVARRARDTHEHRLLRVGSFGALRLLKNHTTAAAAAMMLARSRNADLEFWISKDPDPWGAGILDSLHAMFDGLKWAKLVVNAWEGWAAFRRTVAHMDLCYQLSATETFNVTAADAVAEGVPCVVTPAIAWAPRHWQVDTDRIGDAARVGSQLLADVDASHDGSRALARFTNNATEVWRRYLAVPAHSTSALNARPWEVL
jgi:hypothetical protein